MIVLYCVKGLEMIETPGCCNVLDTASMNAENEMLYRETAGQLTAMHVVRCVPMIVLRWLLCLELIFPGVLRTLQAPAVSGCAFVQL